MKEKSKFVIIQCDDVHVLVPAQGFLKTNVYPRAKIEKFCIDIYPQMNVI